MKSILLLFVFVPFISFAQTNTFPSSGNVGIGTTTPGDKLEVQGHIKSTGWISTGSTSTSGYGGTSGYGILLPSTTNDYIRIFGEHDGSDYSNGVFLTGDNTNDGWIFRQSDCCGAGQLDYAKMARDQFYYIGGKFGIGTTSPSKKLDVNTSVNADGIKIGAGITSTESSANIYLYPSSSYSASRNWLISTFYDNVGDFVIRSSNAQGDDPYTAGTTRFAIANNGNVGIGTTSPSKKLDVNTSENADGIKIGAGITSTESSANIYLYPSSSYSTSRNWLISTFYDNVGDFVIRSSNAQGDDPYTAGTTRFAIANNGNVGIGTSTPQSKLAVNGDISSKKIKVTQTGWPDYVFHSSYKLLPLKDLETYIQQNTHLPEVPSANEVEKNGLNLGDNQAVLLKKIEELTLYIIQLHKNAEEQDRKIIELRDTNKKLEEQSKAIESLTKQVEALKSLLSNK